MFRGWIYPVLCIRTEDIYLAAGLDAVVMLKTIEYGVQLFVPLAVVCLAVCTPPRLTICIQKIACASGESTHYCKCDHAMLEFPCHACNLWALTVTTLLMPLPDQSTTWTSTPCIMCSLEAGQPQ